MPKPVIPATSDSQARPNETGAHETGAQEAGAHEKGTALRRGWTTGACATAALKAALTGLLTGRCPDPVSIRLPKGQEPAFALALEEQGAGRVTCGIIKDAGDDPDVTHGALIKVCVEAGQPGQGLVFKAGQGVGTVTRVGLPIAVGEASITPVPRAMMTAEVAAICTAQGCAPDFDVTIAIPGGQALAEKTLNPRLGIVGGLSILGTTGIVIPFSCSSWIHSIHRGIDVARAAGLQHVAASTGATSEARIQALYDLPDIALIDMGDFAGGTLKYLRDHPVARLSMAGGIGKFAKLAQGYMDLHSSRSQLDVAWMAARCAQLGADESLQERVSGCQTAAQILGLCQECGGDLAKNLCQTIADEAQKQAQRVVGGQVFVDIHLFDRQGHALAQSFA